MTVTNRQEDAESCTIDRQLAVFPKEKGRPQPTQGSDFVTWRQFA
jgi:hypothetical protein